MSQKLLALELEINYQFLDKKLLQAALTHPSIAYKTVSSYQRLEFLGDRILEMVVAELLYREFPEDAEGDLARRLTALVRSEALAEVAQEIGLGKHLIMAKSEEASRGRMNATTLGDACEALIAAIYLDGGFQPAQDFIKQYWHPRLKTQKDAPKDAKSALQEIVQRGGKPPPRYTTLSVEGPDHAPHITVQVETEGWPPMRAVGTSKRQAEQEAARLLLSKIMHS